MWQMQPVNNDKVNMCTTVSTVLHKINCRLTFDTAFLQGNHFSLRCTISVCNHLTSEAYQQTKRLV